MELSDQRLAPPERALPIRHGRLPRSHPARTFLKGIGASLTVLVVSTASIGALALNELSRSVASNAVDISNGASDAAPLPVPHIGAIEGGFNFLMVGTDNDKDQGDAFGERGDATLNDVNILLHVSADHQSGVVVTLPRDLIVPHPKCVDPETGDEYSAMSARPLNEAFERGGLGCVVATVSQLSDLDIPYAGTISFNGVISMTDAIGGVPICLTEEIEDPASDLFLPAGTSVVSGSNALAFLRNRKGVGDRSDLSRISSQQQYMSSLMRTMKSSNTLGDLGKLYGLARAAATNIKLSSNLASVDSMVAMAYAMKDVNLDQLVFVQYPGTTGDPDYPGKVVPTKYLADELFARIAADQPIALGEDAIGPGSTIDPAQPEPAPAPEPPPADAGPVDPAPDAAPPPVAAEVIDGLVGQAASTQTCTAEVG